MKKLFLLTLLLPLLTFAQTESNLVIGSTPVQYDSKTETVEGTYYYRNESLVASEHEGISIVYEFESAVLEAHDTDGDGVLDTFLKLDKFNEIKSVEGSGVSEFERPESVEFSNLLEDDTDNNEAATQEDLVGDLSSIKINLPLLLIMILVLLSPLAKKLLEMVRKEERGLLQICRQPIFACMS